MCPNQGSNLKLGMYPDQELNLQPFGIWAYASTNWDTQPGPPVESFYCISIQS